MPKTKRIEVCVGVCPSVVSYIGARENRFAKNKHADHKIINLSVQDIWVNTIPTLLAEGSSVTPCGSCLRCTNTITVPLCWLVTKVALPHTPPTFPNHSNSTTSAPPPTRYTCLATTSDCLLRLRRCHRLPYPPVSRYTPQKMAACPADGERMGVAGAWPVIVVARLN